MRTLASIIALALAASLMFTHTGGGLRPATATGENSITSPDTADADGHEGSFSSLALDASGNPVVSYLDATNQDLKVLHCNDPDCSGDDESITSPDTEGDVGYWTSLALDASGYPVVSYANAFTGDLKVLHCNDAGCSGDDESITLPDAEGNVGYWTSLALDAGGNPVIVYSDASSGELKVLHCNDPNCDGGDESITSPGADEWVGAFQSLVLDASGYPVVAYYNDTNTELKLLHCNDADCSGGDESITSPDTEGDVGTFPSLALDASGYPVVSYFDNTNTNLKVLHCNDAGCSGGDESITSPDTAGYVGRHTSLALDASGYPVVSYYDDTNQDLKVLRCNDAGCSGGDESIASPDTEDNVGTFSSLALDASGYPVVSYFDTGGCDLNVLHCSDPNCAGKAIAGDTNCDGTVNSIDAALVLQYGAGLVQSLACQGNADVSGDGLINAIDAALILQFTAGLIDSLPP